MKAAFAFIGMVIAAAGVVQVAASEGQRPAHPADCVPGDRPGEWSPDYLERQHANRAAVADGMDNTQPKEARILESRDARVASGIRQFTEPERLGFASLSARATWKVPQSEPGLYDIELIYSSGHIERGQLAGCVEIQVGHERFKVDIPSTGGWGDLQIAAVRDIQLSKSPTLLAVEVISREQGVETVLDLWRVEIFPARCKLPEAGKTVCNTSAHGRYWQYIPRTLREPVGFLVAVHGTPGEAEPESDCAEKFLSTFLTSAKERGLIAIAPIFDTANFGGLAGPGGGYRGLFGRHVGADDFLNEILDDLALKFPRASTQVFLYGHSAGGQFVSRYLVRHPERVLAAVISSAGTYVFPDPCVPWADGMKQLRCEMQWPGEQQPVGVDISPDPERFLSAAQLPITVIYGGLERDADVPNAGWNGKTRGERAELWVKAMRDLADRNGKRANIELTVVEGIGHDGHQLAKTGLPHLFANRNRLR